ncbi:TIGR03808 family TAT-translocated repetitive protein [[Pseudomonas] carboxydohydrogena]|uniref:TIGR03808 family TAT-translocated repetitive protein n=1 Tax=Afipia carboxydohydrogena TaxID=290 RepID=A0ABY8BLL3_AFICR|nr:TIGR03808 family TAT-translocated repetitive protein [[Pseudomonas] carboxydohydrogena]WEF50584.1 TIGR03808 family TAT-translocated repetitive protein [[Pseudomonas] carboxydohydrogena]
MDFTRRRLMGLFSVSAAALMLESVASRAAPPSGRDAGQPGVKPGGGDQTMALQHAINATAAARTPLVLRPGLYRTGELELPSGAQIAGTRGATRLEFTGSGTSLFTAKGADGLNLKGLVLDGGGSALPERRGLVSLQACRDFHIGDCDIAGSGRNAIRIETCSGDIRNTTIRQTAATAIVSVDALGLLIAQNVIQDASENGIEIVRTAAGDDGTIVIDNRIETIKAGPGGTGQYGNAINAFRANNVIVRGNRIRDCDYSGVRGNSASNIQIVGNTVTDAREVALYSEFAFEGAVIANNIVDGCSTGVSVANFNEGGRLAVVQGNIIRNTRTRRYPGSNTDHGGVGIYIEADSNVTGNVIENAPVCGISAGWGKYLRDVNIANNIIRDAFVGIGISAVDGTGKTLVSGNLITNAPRGAIVGYDHDKPVTGDLAVVGASGFPKIVLGLNTVQ